MGVAAAIAANQVVAKATKNGVNVLSLFGFRLFRLIPIGFMLVLALGVGVAVLHLAPAREASPTAAGMVATPSTPILSPDRVTELQKLRPLARSLVAKDGDTLLDLLSRAGVDHNAATQALAALRRIYDPRTLKAGQRVDVQFGPAAHVSGDRPFDSLALSPEPGRRVVTVRGGDGFAASANKLAEIHDTAHFAGAIKTSLFDSALAEGVPPTVIAEMIHAFSYDVDFQRDLQPGDSFEVLYPRTLDPDGQVTRTGEIAFAELVLSGKHLAVYRFVDASGQADYYNDKGESVRKALLRTPVDGARITSRFGMRVNPILGFSMMHKGVDFGVPIGTPVMAAGSGTVEMAGTNGAYGLYIRLKHDKVHSTAYAHLSGLAKGIRIGRKVGQGQVIGYVGESGRATGPHLHYEVLVNNAQVNPMSVKFKAGAVLAGRDLARFKAAVTEVDMRLAGTPLSTQVALNRRAN